MKGTWVYNDFIMCSLQIFESSKLYNSYDDTLSLRSDNQKVYYYIQLESMIEKGVIYSTSECFFSIHEAMEAVKRIAKQDIKWTKIKS